MHLIYELTTSCNNNCSYCYNVWNYYDYKKGQLDLDTIIDLFDELFEKNNITGITLAGGEPLMHNDFFNILTYFSSKTDNVNIASNGVLINEEKAEKIAGRGVNRIEISMPTEDKIIYDEINGTYNLDKVKKAIISLKKYRQKVSVSFVATKKNFDSLEKVLDICYALGVDAISLNRFVPTIANHPLEIDELDLRTTLKVADKKGKKHKLPISVTIPVEDCIISQSDYEWLNFTKCVCGQDKWVIDSLGNLRICEQSPDILGSLFENDFQDLARLDIVNKFRAQNLKENCEDCTSFIICGGGCRFVN